MNNYKLLYISNSNLTRGGVQKCISMWTSNFNNRDNFEITWYIQGKLINKEYYNEILNSGIKIIIGNIDLSKKSKYLKYYKQLLTISKYDFDIVHINTGLVLETFIANIVFKNRTKKLISHSHTSRGNIKENPIKIKLKEMMSHYIIENSNLLLSCSKLAAKNLFGYAEKKSNKYICIYNGIEIDKFKYNEKQRRSNIENYFIANKKVISYIGSLDKTKNIMFALEIFDNILKVDNNVVFWIFGDGDYKKEALRYVDYNKLNDYVFFFGERKDVNNMMSNIDVLLLPSLHEGFPLVAIEAQTAGVIVYASDTITKEINITNNVRFISLEMPATHWSSVIVNDFNRQFNRRECYKIIEKAGLNIKEVSKKIEALYIK